MEVSITKMSDNGQIVIPIEIRKNAGIKPSTKFLVFNEKGTIVLRELKKERLLEEMKLIASIERSEKQLKKGKVVKADTNMKNEDIVRLLLQS